LVLALLATLAVACNAPGPQPSTPSATSSADAGGACGPDEVANSGITGTIVDGDGNPLTDILVQIDNTAGFTGSTHTPDDGTFTALGVTGEFVITTVDLHYDSVTQRVTVPCGETVEVEMILTPSGD
jgi:Carboxypeptidase regulatory-like domain